MTDYAPSLVVLLGETALKQLQVSLVGRSRYDKELHYAIRHYYFLIHSH